MIEKKSEKICIRVTPNQKEKMEKNADKHGVSLSEYITDRALHDRRRGRLSKVEYSRDIIDLQKNVCRLDSEIARLTYEKNYDLTSISAAAADIQTGVSGIWLWLK